MLNLKLQQELFDHIRDGIDRELRATGFKEFLTNYDFDVSVGRLVVARSQVYESSLANIDPDLDIGSRRLATQYEVGVATGTPPGDSYEGILVSEALDGEVHQPVGPGLELDVIQFISVLSSVRKLREARRSIDQLPFLTKSLRRIDPAGD